jgi:hypothetical protein
MPGLPARYFGVRSGWFECEFLIGVVVVGGVMHQCDALVSLPDPDLGYPTPAEMKVAALQRWIETVRLGRTA